MATDDKGNRIIGDRALLATLAAESGFLKNRVLTLEQDKTELEEISEAKSGEIDRLTSLLIGAGINPHGEDSPVPDKKNGRASASAVVN